MAVGKPLNKKNLALSEGHTPDIAMPDYGQQTTVDAQPNPWENQQQEATNNAVQVPDTLPDDVVEAMGEEQEEVQEQQAPQEMVKAKTLREAKERAERERDILMAQMMQMQQQQKNAQPPQEEPQEQDFDLDIDEEALVEGKHLKRLVKELKKNREQQRRYEAQSYESAQTARIKAQYPDFDQVVSVENVETLKEMYPEVARALSATSDIYDKASSAYNVIKNFGIHKDQVYENERAKAVINAQKPRPLASVSPQQGDSPLSKANAFANGMTEELKAQLRKEMFAARRAM